MRNVRISILILVTIGCGPRREAAASSATKPEATPIPASFAPVSTEPAAPSTGSIPAAALPPEAPPQLGSITGTVLETMDSGGYTYLKLKTSNGEVWGAVNQSAVKKGSQVAIANAMLMEGFESKTLKRKFDRIYFGTLASPAAPAANAGASVAGLPPGHPAVPGSNSGATMAAQHAAAAAGPMDVGAIKVEKAEGANGKSVAEIFAEKTSLKDSQVAVRGKVVKFLPGIMGKNWIHLRDGSGSREKQNDDITVTTMEIATVGDVVLVKGVVHLDRDFGAGYAYPVLIEEARISK